MKKLSKASHDLFWTSLNEWQVGDEYGEPIFNYTVYGWSPGSFFTSVLANDFMSAMARSHPANTVPALKMLSGWVINCMPEEAWGSYEKVRLWADMDYEARRRILENKGLIYTPRQETWVAIKGTTA